MSCLCYLFLPLDGRMDLPQAGRQGCAGPASGSRSTDEVFPSAQDSPPHQSSDVTGRPLSSSASLSSPDLARSPEGSSDIPLRVGDRSGLDTTDEMPGAEDFPHPGTRAYKAAPGTCPSRKSRRGAD